MISMYLKFVIDKDCRKWYYIVDTEIRRRVKARGKCTLCFVMSFYFVWRLEYV